MVQEGAEARPWPKMYEFTTTELPKQATRRKMKLTTPSGLVMTAQTEARIHQLLPPPPPKASPSTIVSYIVSLDAFQDALQEELNKSPSAAIKLPNPAGGGYSPVTTAEDLIDARVIIAWCSMLKGEWEEVLKVLPTEREISEEWDSGGGKANEGYIHIARIKSLVLQGAYD